MPQRFQDRVLVRVFRARNPWISLVKQQKGWFFFYHFGSAFNNMKFRLVCSILTITLRTNSNFNVLDYPNKYLVDVRMVTLLYTLLNFNAEKDNKIHVWQRLFLFFTCIRWKVKAPIPSVNKVINSLAHVCVYVCINDKLDSRSLPIVDLKLKLKDEFFLVSGIQLGGVSECTSTRTPQLYSRSHLIFQCSTSSAKSWNISTCVFQYESGAFIFI